MFAARPEFSSQFTPNFGVDLFRYAADAMLLIDSATGDARVVEINPAARRLFRVDRNQAAGFPLKTFCLQQQPNGDFPCGESLRYRQRFIRGDRTEFDADVTLSRIGDSEDDLQLAVVREVAAPGGADSALRRQFESLTGEFEAFSYAVSHDLRAAISGITACSRIMIEDFAAGMNEEARRWLNHIHEDAAQLDRFTDALLEISRISRSTLNPCNLDLTSMAREIIGELSAGEQRCPACTVSEGLEAQGDPFLIRVLLRSLLDNAVKFTRAAANGRIEFGWLASNAAGRPVFFVRDNGRGFDMAYAGRLFVPFQRLHRNPDIGGNGIGLAIARRIVHRHGGEIRAEGTPGAGATFFFTLDRKHR